MHKAKGEEMKKRLVDADKLMKRAKMNSALVTVEHDHHDYGLTLGTLNRLVKECEITGGPADLVSKKAALDAAIEAVDEWDGGYNVDRANKIIRAMMRLPSEAPGGPDNLVNDCISRQAAVTQLSHNKNKGDDEWELAVQNDIQTIWKLPSAQLERKRGKWIRQDNKGKPLYGWYQCSECGAVIGGKANFCSECGADMREVSE